MYPWTLGFVPLDAGVCTLGDYFVLLCSPFLLIVSIKINLHTSFSTKKFRNADNNQHNWWELNWWGIELVGIKLVGIELVGIELVGFVLEGIELVGIELMGI